MRKIGDKNIPNLHNIIESPNKSTTYLLPSLEFRNKEGLNRKEFEKYGLINGYIDYEGNWRGDKNCFYLLFNPSKSMIGEWNKFYEIYRKEKLFIFEEDLDTNVIVLCFKLPPKYSTFVEYFRRGKYSKLNTNNYANKFLIPKDGKLIGIHPYGTIVRSKERIENIERTLGVILDSDSELDEKPDMNLEILNFNKLLEKL